MCRSIWKSKLQVWSLALRNEFQESRRVNVSRGGEDCGERGCLKVHFKIKKSIVLSEVSKENLAIY